METKKIPAIFIALTTALFLLLPSMLFSAQNKGRAEIILEGGKDGPVHFAHHKHQQRISDCQVCHKDFAQKKGAIQEAIAAGKLKKKYVMNKTCNKCHRIKKPDGQKTGPTKCKACHKK